MDVSESEIGQKMRSAIKAKLTELGCYVDDELPDYVMVMVANKRTRSQMEDDLTLFLGSNTELFVCWLHQVLKKLQEVSVSVNATKEDFDKNKKEKKEKSKKSNLKKSKKKEKEKEKARKKQEKKLHKSKKKAKDSEMIRPNVAPFLMNMEKEPEPSITDAFAGQILKNHGVMLNPSQLEMSKEISEVKRPAILIIDPATISSQSEVSAENSGKFKVGDQPNEKDQLDKGIQDLRYKLSEKVDSISDDEDFINIRTEPEELMNDFADDVLKGASKPPPITRVVRHSPVASPAADCQKRTESLTEPETLPQIELVLPKRPVRERLGVREIVKVSEKDRQQRPNTNDSPERLTPEREPEIRPQVKSAKSRLGSVNDTQKRTSELDESSEKTEGTKRLCSQVSSLGARSRSTCASVVRVRPRPRVGAPASNLLMRAVADAHKSLLSIPPKVDASHQTVKRALVLPMRRCVEKQKIVVQVAGESQPESRAESRGDSISLGDPDSGSDISFKLTGGVADKGEVAPRSITKVITNTEFSPSRTCEKDLDIETINIHSTSLDKNKSTKFIVTMEGYNPNVFLTKKLRTEGVLDDEEPVKQTKLHQVDPIVPASLDAVLIKEVLNEKEIKATRQDNIPLEIKKERKSTELISPQKRLSDTSEDSATQVIIKQDKIIDTRKYIEFNKQKEGQYDESKQDAPRVKKRKASPIVFDVDKKEKKEERTRERTTSASSDSNVILTTPIIKKYDALPPLAQAERKPWCRAFPTCRYGAACAFAHPRCKFGESCIRRGCVYSHAPSGGTATPPTLSPGTIMGSDTSPLLASQVVPAPNYKSTSSAAATLCKYYPACANPACHYHHPKPCRYGRACANKSECNFFHNDINNWKYSI